MVDDDKEKKKTLVSRSQPIDYRRPICRWIFPRAFRRFARSSLVPSSSFTATTRTNPVEKKYRSRDLRNFKGK